MAVVAVAATRLVEGMDAAATGTAERSLDFGADGQDDGQDVESWLNVSRNGCWNRLHTHEGAAWSGVYYAAAGSGHTRKYAGKLVLKPTPHPAEDKWPLLPDEAV